MSIGRFINQFFKSSYEKESERYFAEKDRRRREDPYRYKIVETKWHDGRMHIDVHCQPPGGEFRSITDDYGFNNMEEAKQALEQRKKVDSGQITLTSTTVVHQEEMPQ